MAAIWGSEIVKSGLVLYLDAGNQNSYPGTGTTWTDISRNNNNGTLTNGPTFNSESGGSIVFDGTNDYVSANAPNFATTNSFTAMLWTKSNTSTWNATGMLLSKRNQFIIHPLAGGTVVEYYVFAGSWVSISYTHTNITSWNLYCMTYSAGSLRAYLNGNLINSSTVNSTLGSDTGQVFIGWDDGLAGRYYNGSTAMVSLYNRALSATEIQQNYNATKSRFGL